MERREGSREKRREERRGGRGVGRKKGGKEGGEDGKQRTLTNIQLIPTSKWVRMCRGVEVMAMYM
jgi:hypothetical protein